MRKHAIVFRNVAFLSRDSALIALSLILLLCSKVRGQEPAPLRKAAVPATTMKAKTDRARPSTPHELTAGDLDAFLDGFINPELERDDIGGAVISVVKDGNVLFEKGYGYADLAKKRPVLPEDTLFRPGSVSKLITSTAVMQLVEQGKLDLDRDINDCLDFKIPSAYAEPVTLRRILVHTAGFEETVKELFVATPAEMMPLPQYLLTHMPTRIYPPGTLGAYSNYGMAVAGYIVQRVSGEPFDQYVANHIFKPLGMVHSTFSQPLPASLLPLMSEGYQKASDGPKPFEYIPAAPAGALSTSGDDIAHFMIAHLEDGRYAEAQILRPETAHFMHSRQYTGDPALNGIAISFFEESRNGHHIIGHGGDTIYFHSHLHLILDSNVGLFMSFNSAGHGDFDQREALWDQFLDRYFSYKQPAIPTLVTAPTDARTLTGSYIASRRGETNFLKIGALLGEATITAKPDGTLTTQVIKGFNGLPKRWSEIGPLIYQEIEGQRRIAFKRDTTGRLVIVSDLAPFAFQRVSWNESQSFLETSLFGAGIIFLLTLLLWLTGALIRRHYGRSLTLGPPERRLRLLVRLTCALNFFVIVGLLVLLSMAADSLLAFLSSRMVPLFWLLEFASFIGGLATIIVFYQVCKSWATTGRWIWAKIGDTVILLACLAFVWFIWVGHLANFNLRY